MLINLGYLKLLLLWFDSIIGDIYNCSFNFIDGVVITEVDAMFLFNYGILAWNVLDERLGKVNLIFSFGVCLSSDNN